MNAWERSNEVLTICQRHLANMRRQQLEERAGKAPPPIDRDEDRAYIRTTLNYCVALRAEINELGGM